MPPTTLTLACACQTITASIPLPPSTTTLPLPLEICHCASCRHASGQLAITCFPCPRFPPNDPNNPNHPNNKDNHDGPPTLTITSPTHPTAYKTSADLIRYFCPQCGASIYIENTASGEVEVCSGVLGPVEEGEGGVESVVRFARQIFLGNTRDGGMGVWVEGPRWRGWPDSEVFEVPGVGEGGVAVEGGGGEKREKREERRLQGYCHCRGVEFYVTPPDEEEDDEHAESASGAEKKDSQWYLRASGTKYLAGLCACNSCRLATGHDLQAWAFIPHSHIHHPQDGSIFNLRPEGSEGKGNTTTTLKTYSHTPGAKRGFCGRCGATVFWSHEERRGDVIDISVGLLEEEGGGARAEGWLEWRTEGVSFAECALNKELVGMVVEGLGKWGEGRGKVGGQGG